MNTMSTTSPIQALTPDQIQVGDTVFLYPTQHVTGVVVELPGQDRSGRAVGGRHMTHFLLRNGDVLFEHEYDPRERVRVIPRAARAPRPGNNPFTSDRGW